MFCIAFFIFYGNLNIELLTEKEVFGGIIMRKIRMELDLITLNKPFVTIEHGDQKFFLEKTEEQITVRGQITISSRLRIWLELNEEETKEVLVFDEKFNEFCYFVLELIKWPEFWEKTKEPGLFNLTIEWE